MRREGLEKDTGWQQVITDQPSYSKMRTALRNGDETEAKRILTALRRTHTDPQIVKAMKLSAKRPFTGSRKNERVFVLSLNDQDSALYSKARQQRTEELERFYDFFLKQFQPTSRPQ